MKIAAAGTDEQQRAGRRDGEGSVVNLIRITVAEWLLGLALRVAPKDFSGRRLAALALEYFERRPR
jgi:hypothetical protein